MSLPFIERDILNFFIVLIVMMAYALYSRSKTTKRLSHHFFAMAALALTFLSTLIYAYLRMKWTDNYKAAPTFQGWVFYAALGYGIYFFTARQSAHVRRLTKIAMALFLSAIIFNFGFFAHAHHAQYTRSLVATKTASQTDMSPSPCIEPPPSLLGSMFPTCKHRGKEAP